MSIAAAAAAPLPGAQMPGPARARQPALIAPAKAGRVGAVRQTACQAGSAAAARRRASAAISAARATSGPLSRVM